MQNTTPQPEFINIINAQPSQRATSIEIIAQNLNTPWEIAFLPGNEILITERPGTLLFVKNEQKITIPEVAQSGEGGLLGLALHPDFPKNKLIYLYFTTQSEGNLTNQVVRYRLENNQLSQKQIILENITGAANHDGGRITFGPDGYLYITTGDAQNPDSSQDTNSLNGKILRIKDDGSIPTDNPFNNAVYAYGLRNPQGITWDDQKSLWATDHGRSGAASGFDELNQIEKGQNYGWPAVQGDETRRSMIAPVINSGATITWAPSGATFYNSNILFTGLRGETLYVYNMRDRTLKEYFKNQFGRIRTVAKGPDGNLYILTNNTDGRGNPNPNDDKLIKISNLPI